MTHHIEYGRNCFVVSPRGGTVTQWMVGGRNILFPQQFIDFGSILQLRGGIQTMHPNFGPASLGSGFQDHGYLRKAIIPVQIKPGGKINARYAINNAHLLSEYPYIHSVNIDVAFLDLENGGLSHTVEVHRVNEDAGRSMPFGGGIHPYFFLPYGTGHVKIFGEIVEITGAFGPKVYSVKQFETIQIQIQSYGLGTVNIDLTGAYIRESAIVVIWTDGGVTENGGSYVCVEPVVADPSVFGTKEGIWLAPGERIKMGCEMKFTPTA